MIYEDFIQKIDDFIRKYYLNKMLRGSIFLFVAVLASFLILVIAEYYGYFSPLLKTILFYIFLISQLLLAYFMVIKPLLGYLKLGKTLNYNQAADIIGKHFPEIGDKLTNTLQLKNSPNHQQTQLIQAAINQKISQMQPIPFVSAIKINENKKYIPYALFPLGIIIILAFWAPSILKDGTERIINHSKVYQKKAPFSFHIQNKTLKAVEGEDFLLNLKLKGEKIPQEIYLETNKSSFKLKKNDILHFSYLFKNLQESQFFRFRAGEFYSENYELKVSKKPLITKAWAQLSYPKYLNKPNQTIDNIGDFTVPEGTQITWHFNTVNTKQLFFTLNGKTLLLNSPDHKSFKVVSTLKESTPYSVKTNEAKDSLTYQINIIKDAYPQIEIEEKIDSANARVIYFLGKISDDYGLNQLSFHYTLKNQNGLKHYKVPIKFSGSTHSNFMYFWSANALKIQDGDEIEYHFEISDNDGVNGPKTTKSTEKIYRLSTTEENFTKVNESSEAVKSKLQNAVKQSKKLQEDARKLNQELLNNKNFDYEQQKQVKELLEKQEKLEKLLKEISEENKKNMLERSQIEKDKELLEKQKQIQELFDNVLDEKTKELLKNLQKLLDEKNKDTPQPDNMKQLQNNHKSMEKELDRILELYKKLEAEQKLNESIQKLEELAQKQEQNSKENNTPKQNEINKSFNDIKKDLKEAKEKNEGLERPDNFDFKEDLQKNIEKDIQNAAEELKQQQKDKASKTQKDATQKMKELANSLKAMQQESAEQQLDIDIKTLRQILQNLLKISFDQEKVLLGVKNTNPNNPKFNDLGKKQREIKDNFKIVEDSLYNLSKKVPQISTAVNKEVGLINNNIAEALENIPDRNIMQINRNQQYAMTSVNNLALMLSEAMQQMQNAMKNAKSGGKGKPKPGLSELTKMQEKLNQNMQQAKEQMQKNGAEKGKSGESGMSQQFSEMAKQQQMIRQTLKELNERMNKDGSGKLGNLEKIMKEMEQTETELVNKRITQESLKRQEDIKIKLLEAEKAEREREQDSERDSKTGKDFAPNYNLILEEFNKKKNKDSELLKTVPPGLNDFYKHKSNQYLEKIKLEE